MLILLTVDGDRLAAVPVQLNKCTVLGILGVKLLEGVLLVIRSDVENGQELLATDDKSTLDNGVEVLSEDGGDSENVLAGSFNSLSEATDEVLGHESHLELIVVVVVSTPDGVLLERNSLPNPLHGLGEGASRPGVGVVALQLVEREGGAGQKVNRMLGLGSRGGLILLSFSSGLSSRFGGGLGSLRLLGSDIGQGRLLKERQLLGNGSDDGLVDNSLVPTSGVGVLLAPLLVEEVLEATVEERGAEQVSESDALANQEGVVEQVLLNDIDGLLNDLGGVINILLVVGGLANERSEPVAERLDDLRVDERHPLQDGSIASTKSALESQRTNGLGGNTYSCLVLPRRVVFSF